MDSRIISKAERIHSKAAKAGSKKLQKVEITKIISLVVKCCAQEITPTEAASTLVNTFEPAFKAYVRAFAQEAAREALKNTDFKDLEKLTKPAFSKKLKKCTDKVSTVVSDYMDGKIDDVELIDRLMKTGITDIGKDVLCACGVDIRKLKTVDGKPVELGSPVVGYLAICKAYEILMKALDDAHLAFEHRLAVEEECRKSVEMIREYRLRMEQVVSDYLTDHIEVFENGFAAMDQAILENDSDGYIRGNVEIQKLLNYDVQFNNQEEFDDLMESDLALKL